MKGKIFCILIVGLLISTTTISATIITNKDEKIDKPIYKKNEPKLYNTDLVTWTPEHPRRGDIVTFYSHFTCLWVEWDFDYDGVYDAWGQTAQWTWFKKGIYTIRILYQYLDDTISRDFTIKIYGRTIKENNIEIENTILNNELSKPIAEFYWIPSNPKVGEQVLFVSQAVDPDGPCTQWAWDFDHDGVDDAWGEIAYWTFYEKKTYLIRHWVAGNNYANDITDCDSCVKSLGWRIKPINLFLFEQHPILYQLFQRFLKI